MCIDKMHAHMILENIHLVLTYYARKLYADLTYVNSFNVYKYMLVLYIFY